MWAPFGGLEALTFEGSTLGTFDYLSPEQACNPHAIDIRSDIYSLGCCLYHMFSGSVPFPAATLPEKLAAHGWPRLRSSRLRCRPARRGWTRSSSI